jgi:hypothetical protein
MSEPLLGTAAWNAISVPPSIELVGHVAGPAGSHLIPMDGLDIDVDVASPRIANRVWVEDTDRLRDRSFVTLLVRLLGGDVVEEVVGLVARGTGTARMTHEDRGSNTGCDLRIAALGAACTAASTPSQTRAEEALAVLEAALAAQDLGLLSHMPELAEDAEHAGEWLAAQRDQVLPDGDSETLTAAEQVLRRATVAFNADLTAVLQRLEVAVPVSSAPPRLVMSAPTPVTSDPHFARDSLPMLVAGRAPSLTAISNDEYEVRLPGWGERVDGYWVRAFRDDELAPLVTAPMITEHDDAVASLLLPHDGHDRLVFDIVENITARRSTPAVVAFRLALATGTAQALWLEASSLHAEAGDETRARLAEAIANDELAGSRAMSRRAFDPLLTDRLGPH